MLPLLTELSQPGRQGKTASAQTTKARRLKPEGRTGQQRDFKDGRVADQGLTVRVPVDRALVGRVEVRELDFLPADEKVVCHHDAGERAEED
jgi:hypothetical protein